MSSPTIKNAPIRVSEKLEWPILPAGRPPREWNYLGLTLNTP
jgi:hypothetical protein